MIQCIHVKDSTGTVTVDNGEKSGDWKKVSPLEEQSKQFGTKT